MDFRRPEEAAVPEANQQTEDMRPTRSPIPDENNQMNPADQTIPFQGRTDPQPGVDTGSWNTQPAADAAGVGTVINAQPVEETFRRQVIGIDQIHNAVAIMQKYRMAKATLDNRLIEEEKWWELRHWDVINESQAKEEKEKAAYRPKPTSASSTRWRLALLPSVRWMPVATSLSKGYPR
jgi:hypothetical protein